MLDSTSFSVKNKIAHLPKYVINVKILNEPPF